MSHNMVRWIFPKINALNLNFFNETSYFVVLLLCFFVAIALTVT